jgi:hypothetical protein
VLSRTVATVVAWAITPGPPPSRRPPWLRVSSAPGSRSTAPWRDDRRGSSRPTRRGCGAHRCELVGGDDVVCAHGKVWSPTTPVLSGRMSDRHWLPASRGDANAPLGQQGSGASGTGRWGCPRAGRGASTVHSAGPARSAAQSAPAPPPVSRPGGVLASRVISCERRACLMRGLRPTPGRSPSPSSPRRRSGPSGSHRLPATAKRGGDGRHSPSVPGRRDDLRPTDPIRRGRSRRCSSRSAFLQRLTQTSGWLIERPESAPGVTRLPTSCADDTGRRQRTHDRE